MPVTKEMCFKFTTIVLLLTLLHFISFTHAVEETNRKPKFIFDFIRPASNMPISKEIPENKNLNSPIYYIRMPPIPYTYIPGLGYVSNPQNGAHDLVNLPLPFLGNGRPVTIYQWSQVPLLHSPTLQNNNENMKESTVNRLDGNYVFNGKLNKKMYVLGNEYNSLYDEDVLNNIYP